MTTEQVLTRTSYAVSTATAAGGAITSSAVDAAPALIGPIQAPVLYWGLPLSDWGVVAGMVGIAATYATTLYFKARDDQRKAREEARKERESELRIKQILGEIPPPTPPACKVVDHGD